MNLISSVLNDAHIPLWQLKYWFDINRAYVTPPREDGLFHK